MPHRVWHQIRKCDLDFRRGKDTFLCPVFFEDDLGEFEIFLVNLPPLKVSGDFVRAKKVAITAEFCAGAQNVAFENSTIWSEFLGIWIEFDDQIGSSAIYFRHNLDAINSNHRAHQWWSNWWAILIPSRDFGVRRYIPNVGSNLQCPNQFKPTRF